MEEKHDKALSMNFSFLQQQLTVIEKSTLIANMEQLSGHPSWKIIQVNGLVAWIELPDMEEAMHVQDVLIKTNALTVSPSQRKDNGNPIIKCEQINYKKIDELAKKSSASVPPKDYGNSFA